MKRTMKKLLALMMALAMVMSLMVVAYAGDSEQPEEDNDVTTEEAADNSDDAATGAGSYEGYVDEEVFRVTLPTVEAPDLNFIIDPQKLITATEGAMLGDNPSFEEDSTLFFQNTSFDADEADDDEFEWSSNTAKFKVINKGGTDVDVELTVTATGTAVEAAEGESALVSFTDDDTFEANDKDKVLYIALNTQATGEEEATAVPIALDGTVYTATATAKIAKTDGVYKYDYDADEYADNNGYGYVLMDEDDESFPEDFEGFQELEFWLSGAANPAATGDWGLGAEGVTLGLNVTWKVTKFEPGPKVKCTPVESLGRGTEIVLNVTNMTGYELTSITYGATDTQVSFTPTAVEGVAGAYTVSIVADRNMASALPTDVKVIFTPTNAENEATPEIDPKTVTIYTPPAP